mgnify:CR=1 FL=1
MKIIFFAQIIFIIILLYAMSYVTMDYEKWYTSLLWHNVKKSVHWKFKIMTITCRFHISDIV